MPILMVDDRPILVTGANGFVGSHLADHLLMRGCRVRALVRRTSDLRFLPLGVEVVFGDVTDPPTLPAAVAGIRAAYHVAGLVASFRTPAYFEVNEAGTRSLLGACRKGAPDLTRFVLVSSLAAAGPSRAGLALKETDTPAPVSVYGASKLAGERVARDAGDLPVTIVRPPVVYGPRDSDMLTFFQLVANRLAPAFPRQKFYSICHVRDLVRGIAMAGESPASIGRTYHLASDRVTSLDGLLRTIADALGVKPRRVPLPEPLLRFLAPAADALLPALGVPVRPLSDKVREMLPDYWIADTSAARRDLGFRTEIGLQVGVAETARFYRSVCWL
jgi:nucleoside-diphosphate-sugar epimerase